MRKPAKKHGPKAEMNVVPYIDVMLVLLVIFMVTAPMLTQGVKIELPKVASEALVNDKQQTILTLSVKADGGYYWNLGSELDTKNQTDSAVSLEELQAKVGQVVAQDSNTQVYIRADNEADAEGLLYIRAYNELGTPTGFEWKFRVILSGMPVTLAMSGVATANLNFRINGLADFSAPTLP